jgi:AAA15 family ATPase/GTPase
MFIKELYIKDFRLFHNINIKLGKYITAISGFNATGKSTILGLLGHCGEFKRYKPLLQTAFRAELSEILKFSEKYDKKTPDLATIKFEDIPILALGKLPTELEYRSTVQKYLDGVRYRIIPKKTSQWPTSAKITWPTLYLGLGRLYPIGESINVSVEKLKGKISDNDNSFIINSMKFILSMRDEPSSFTAASISETTKKKAIGVNTESYDYLANSAGQDNLGQILMALLSFNKLKEQFPEIWNGGLLVVDELDAALHPLAQNKLVDFLYKQAEKIGIQVVFTTHSLGLLDYISKKTEYNKNEDINQYELVCLTNGNGPVEVVQNPSFNAIYSELMATFSPSSRRISIFSEDEEARFFIKNLLEKYSDRIRILEANFGYDDLLRMLGSDFTNFSQYIYILDGDVTDINITTALKRVKPATVTCVIKLPGLKRPEQVIWEYLKSLSPEHKFLEWGKRFGYSLRNIDENGPFSIHYNNIESERLKYKEWFRENQQLVTDVFVFWIDDNKSLITEFQEKFIKAYNAVARQNLIPVIREK